MKYYVNVSRVIEIDVEDKQFEEMVNKQESGEEITETEFKAVFDKLEKLTGIPVYDYENTDDKKDSIWAVYTENNDVLIEM